MLELPDRDALLDFFDDKARNVESRTAVSVRRSDCDTYISESERAEAMLDDERRDAESIFSFGDDLLELRLCHRCVRRIINRGNTASVVGVAHGSNEKRNRSEFRRLHLGDQGGGDNFSADDG